MRVTDLDSYLASFDGEPGYLDWAAFGPLSPAVRSEAQGDTELLGSGRRTSIELVADHVREARELVAELIGTDAEHVVLQPSTTYGLMHAVYGLGRGLVDCLHSDNSRRTVSLSNPAPASCRRTIATCFFVRSCGPCPDTVIFRPPRTNWRWLVAFPGSSTNPCSTSHRCNCLRVTSRVIG